MRSILISVTLIVLTGIAVPGALAQQNDQPGPRPGPGPGVQAPCRPEPMGELLGEFAARLGANLGVSEEEMRPALAETLQGLRPQIEAQLRQICQPRPGPPGSPAPAGVGFGGVAFGGGVVGLTAQILGLEPEVVRAELEQGKSLASVAAEHGVDPEMLAEQLTQAMEEMRLQQMRQQIRRLLSEPQVRPER